MADEVVLMDDSGESQTYENIETVELDNGDGSTTKYVNENLIDKLPAVTEADNGKVFGVVDGKWQAMDAPSGMPEVTEEDNGKVAGVVDGVWQPMEAPSGGGTAYTHPDTHPSVMIGGIAPVATGGNYESLYNTPCGPEVVIPLGEHRMTKIEAYDDVYEGMAVAEHAPAVGEVLRIAMGGSRLVLTEYTGTVKDSGGTLYIGNRAILVEGSEDTGEDYYIVFYNLVAVLNMRKSLLYSTGSTKYPWCITMGIVLENAVRKLDAKYLPDGIATEEFVRNAVAAGGGGTAVTETVILEETVITLTCEDDPVTESSQFECKFVEGDAVYAAVKKLVGGEPYKVVCNGTEYRCTAIDFAAKYAELSGFTTNSFIILGNGAIFDGQIFEDTGEPFVLVGADVIVEGAQDVMAVVTAVPGVAGAPSTQEVTVAIYGTSDIQVSWENVTNKPFGDEIVKKTMFSEAEVVFPGDAAKSDGRYNAYQEADAATLELWATGDWQTAEVIWDGVTYGPLTKTKMEGVYCVGNPLFYDGEDDGTPFGLTFATAGFFGETPVMLVISAYDEADASAETLPDILHTVGVTIDLVTPHKIEDKYQHQADWEERDESKAGFILNRPFGKIQEGGEVLVDVTGTYDAQDLGFYLCEGSYPDSLTSLISADKVVIGGRYTIQVGDYTYTGVGIDPLVQTGAIATCRAAMEVFDGDARVGYVKFLQTVLKGAGYYDGDLDASYGARTKDSVVNFQASNGLEADGKAGPKTMAVITSGKFVVKHTNNDIEEREDDMRVYNTVKELPEWAQKPIGDLVDMKIIAGIGENKLGLSDIMVRIAVMLYRGMDYIAKRCGVSLR